jgi:predicted phosphate transport protein (TIGR00153 family)
MSLVKFAISQSDPTEATSVRLRFRLLPSDERFFALFNQAAMNAAECARRLGDMITDFEDLEGKHQLVADCERRGDQLTTEILQRLDGTFVTPFDREDIHALAEELDDVVDDMLAVSDLLRLLSIDAILPELKEQADLLVQMGDQTVGLMGRLQSMKGTGAFLKAIDQLETEGDAVYHRCLSRLFSGDYEALEVLKWKDIVQAMEAALNTVEDISDVVESIVLKHA